MNTKSNSCYQPGGTIEHIHASDLPHTASAVCMWACEMWSPDPDKAEIIVSNGTHCIVNIADLRYVKPWQLYYIGDPAALQMGSFDD